MVRFIFAILTLLSLAVTPFGSAAATAPCEMADGASMPTMKMGNSHSAPVDKCCDPVTKACLSSCSVACATVADVAGRIDVSTRLAKVVIAPGLTQLRLAAHEPGWLDPPPKLVA